MNRGSGADLKQLRDDFLDAHQGAIEAVGGRASVAAWLRRNPSTATHVVGIGKAAAAMVAGVLDVLGKQVAAALAITKADHLAELETSDPRLICIESSHPVAAERALVAGRALRDFFLHAPRDTQFVLCLSGGASALVEDLAPGLDAAFLSRMNDWLLAGGLPIDAINRIRKRVSRIKAGRLAQCLAGRPLTCLMISDVPADDIKTIGSGLLIEHRPSDLDVSRLDLPAWLAEVTARAPDLAGPECFATIIPALVAKPRDACAAAATVLQSRGYPVRVHGELLQGDALVAGARLVAEARRQPDLIHIRSSETTVVLPEHPGRGGRCQALALAAAVDMPADKAMVVLAAGTDGTDGPGDVAGALVDNGTVARGRLVDLDAPACLRAADAGRFLDASGDLLRTGPTGTNVMDLLITWSA